MCGVAVIVDSIANLEETDLKTMRLMLDTLEPRGPDGEGICFLNYAVVGQKRLSIVDAQYGAQPMTSGDGRFTIAFNGEIYNHLNLRKELIAAGYNFQSDHSDTETLLCAYQHWGKECLSRINGDFAFIIWDDRLKSLFAARDALGVKPLFYCHRGNRLVCASEVKAILEDCSVDRIVNPYSIIEIFSCAQPLYPNTFVKDVFALEPGNFLTFDVDGLIIQRYWDFTYFPHTLSEEEIFEGIRNGLDCSVQDRLMGEVDICALLSGGVDSSAICESANRFSVNRVKTYSVNFATEPQHLDWSDGKDSEFAGFMSRILNSEHKSIVVDQAEIFGRSNDVARVRDLPCAMSQEIAMLKLFEGIKNKQTVVLSGEGADEVSSGYYFFFSEKAKNGMINPIALDMGSNEVFRRQMFHTSLRRHTQPLEYLEALGKEIWESIPNFSDNLSENTFKKLQYCHLRHFLPYLLDRVDRLSMACGLETRVPFCDHKLSQFIFNIPSNLLMRRGIEKYALRKALRNRLPEKIINRRKSVFPYLASSELNGRLYSIYKSVTAAPESNVRRILSPSFVSKWYETARRDTHAAKGFQAGMLSAITLEHLTSVNRLSLDF